MRFMMLMIPLGYETAAPDVELDPERVKAMMKYNEALQEAGVLIALDGLHPPSMGARVSFPGGKPHKGEGKSVPASTALSEQISKDMKKRGFKFVGPTIVYAWMQAVGIVDDHTAGCFRRGRPGQPAK